MDELLENAKQTRNIIRYRAPGEDGPYHDRISARAEPNSRLVQVFGIDNVFTNLDDRSYQLQFIQLTVNKMKKAIKLNKNSDDEDWTELRGTAIRCFDEYIKKHSDEVCLLELVQFVTLKLSLGYLFDEAEEAMNTYDSFDDIVYIGNRINELWIQSKGTEDQRPKWENETKLQGALGKVTSLTRKAMPGAFDVDFERAIDPSVPRKNPMNLLLPAYETMWRVVLRCIMEIGLRGAEGSANWRYILIRYLDNLGSDEALPNGFWEEIENSISAEDVVKEALRLYPPSRRVHRLYNGTEHSADIEACHRSALLGQNDPLVFRPERWQELRPDLRIRALDGEKAARKELKNEEEKLGFMPFAFICTADRLETRNFGMKMIALLVAVVLKGLGEDWRKDQADHLPDIGIALETDRHSYNSLKLKRKGRYVC